MASKPPRTRWTRDSKGLWRCPRCGAGLVTRHMWHSCVRLTVDHLFLGKPKALRLYRALVRGARRVARFEIVAQKTRIVFLARTRFASVARVGRAHLVVSLGLPRDLRHPRVRSVQHAGTGWWGNEVRVDALADLDAEFWSWFEESYRLMGLRERLRGRKKAKKAS